MLINHVYLEMAAHADMGAGSKCGLVWRDPLLPPSLSPSLPPSFPPLPSPPLPLEVGPLIAAREPGGAL